MLTRALILSLLLAAPALAQEKKKDDTLDTAGRIASQPARDVGIAKTKVPPLLERTLDKPYARPANGTCTGLKAEIAQFNAVLGADFGGDERTNQKRSSKIAAAGGEAIVNSLIPFRGIVREVSGAGPAERRLQAAVTTGVARRAYLRGIASAKGCKF